MLQSSTVFLQTYLILLCFALLRLADTEIFSNWRLVATQCPASLFGIIFPTGSDDDSNLLAIKYF